MANTRTRPIPDDSGRLSHRVDTGQVTKNILFMAPQRSMEWLVICDFRSTIINNDHLQEQTWNISVWRRRLYLTINIIIIIIMIISIPRPIRLFCPSFVCLSIYLLALSIRVKATDRIHMIFVFQRCGLYVDKEELLNFGSYPQSAICIRMYFCFERFFVVAINRKEGSLPLNFASRRYMDPKFQTPWIQTRFVLAEVCALRVLLISGVTRVGVTRGGNWGCHPYFFLKKLTTFFSFFCSSLSLLLISLGCHPWTGSPPHLFYLSDLVSPLGLLFANLPTKIFSFGCHPLEVVTL